MHGLIPLPSVVDLSAAESFTLDAATTVRLAAADDRLLSIATVLVDLVGLAAGPEKLRIASDAVRDDGPAICLRIGQVAGTRDEGYELTIDARRITIVAPEPAGLFYGVQTLRQLLPPYVEYGAIRPDKRRSIRIPTGRVLDSPRFSWRGAMLDVARHFFSVQDVERFIDLLALHKLNRLHLHLTDDQGWRIEVKAWPKLATHGGSTQVGGGRGGYFTQEDYAALVDYAKQRFITIVPEIDVPGHTNAALASYAELSCSGEAAALHTGIDVGFSALCVDNERTYTFVEDVVREIAALTPGPFFHIGGDEVQSLTAAQYCRFIERVQEIVEKCGKRMIGWDEISPVRLMPGTIVQHWRPKTTPRDAVAQGAQIIMSHAERTYLDMKYDASTPIGLAWAGPIDARQAYDWDPGSAAEGVPESAVLGVEAPLWTETVANIRDAEFLAFPRLAAIAEVAWTPVSRREWADFSVRLGRQAPRWSALGLNFHRAPEIAWERTPPPA